MPIKLQTWKPDTCDCVIEQTHDPSDPRYGVVFSKFIEKCLVHQALSDEDAYGKIYEDFNSEQKCKNILQGELLDNTIFGISETVIENGRSINKLKIGIFYNWQFDENRKLIIDIAGISLPPPIKTLIQNFCNTTFGLDKVQIQ